MNPIDAVVIVAYLVLILGVGLFLSRHKKENVGDYFFANRQLPWFIIGASYVATGMNTEQLVGMVGQAYNYGIVLANWDLIGVPLYTLLIWVFLPVYLRNRIGTMPEYLERRYGAACRDVLAVVVVLGYIFINLSTVFYAGAFILSEFTGFPLLAGLLTLAVVASLHTALGGLETVAWLNLLQFVVLISAGLLLFVLGIHAVPGGWEEVLGEGERVHLIQPLSHPLIPWTAVVLIIFTSGIWYCCTNQFLVQQCLGARTEWDARMGIVFAGVVVLFRPIVEVFPGMIAYRLYELDNVDGAFTTLLAGVVPAGLRGLIIAGVLAGVLSTIESIVNATSTVFTMEIYKKRLRKAASERELMLTGRVTMVGVTLLAVLEAPVIQYWTIFEYFQTFLAFLAAPMSAVFVMGLLWRRANSAGALTAMIFGFPATLICKFWLLPESNPFHLAALSWIVCIVLIFTVSLLTPPDLTRGAALGWSPRMALLPEGESVALAWYKRPVLYWSGVCVLWVAIYVWFW